MADIFGTNGSDVKDGTGEDDFISGGPQGGDPSQEVGADTLNGFGGNDVIHGLGGNDVISGNGEDDQLFGGDGDDVLNGNSGNDLIVGGAGADTMNGGTGSDTVDFGAENGSSGVTVNLLGTGSQGGLAADTAVDSFGFKDTVKNIPNVIGTSFADFIYGGNHANKLTGGGGNDYLFGGLANDTLSGGDGNDQINGGVDADTMIGSVGNDTYFVDNAGDTILEAAGEGTDTVASSVTYVLTAGAAVETLRTTSNGGTGAINLTGNAFDQTIIGNNGTNVLKGGGGKDTLQGLGGNDTYLIYTATDKVLETATGGTVDKVAAAVSYTLAAGVHVEQMSTTSAGGTSAINLGGNELVQMMTGNAGANRLEGKGGADQLRGLGGADTFVFATKLGGGNIDAILDFSVPDDRFLLSDAIFTALNPGTLAASAFRANTTGLAGDATDRIIYETDTGKVFYDADGTGATAGIHFATITAGLALTNADFSVA